VQRDSGTEVIESPFAGVRLRTVAAKRFKQIPSGACHVHRLLVGLAQTCPHLKAADLCRHVPLPEVKRSRGNTKPLAA
jgi:hypothetical protein